MNLANTVTGNIRAKEGGEVLIARFGIVHIRGACIVVEVEMIEEIGCSLRGGGFVDLGCFEEY